MNITLEQWKRIEIAQHRAKEAVGQLETAIIDTMVEHAAGGELEKQLLVRLLEMAEASSFELFRIDVHPQMEWMGGDSSDPKNFKLREPNCVPLPRGYLS